MTIEELKEIVKDATQQAFDGERISPDEKGNTWSIIAGERLWFRTLLNSVDAEPTKHGKWIYEDEIVTCSNCGGFWTAKDLTKFPHYYCPHCGAKMDESEV